MRARTVQPLNERSLSDVVLSDIVTKEFVDEQQAKDYNMTGFVLQYLNEEPIITKEEFDPNDEEDIQEIAETEEFKNWFEYELEYRFENLKDKFDELTDENDNIKLYRAMSVSSDYLDKLKNNQVKRIGEYWAFNPDKAEAHWMDAKMKDEIIIESEINEKYIDWENTFRLNLEHENFNDEEEIRLYKNTPLKILNLKWNDEYIDDELLNIIKSYTYLS